MFLPNYLQPILYTNLAPENGHHGGYAGLAGMTVTVNGSSPGLSLSLDATGGSANNTAVIVSGVPTNSQTTNNNNNNTSTANHNHAGGGSPVDHSSLIILQPSGAAGYSSMLPSFTHYASGKSQTFGERHINVEYANAHV